MPNGDLTETLGAVTITATAWGRLAQVTVDLTLGGVTLTSTGFKDARPNVTVVLGGAVLTSVLQRGTRPEFPLVPFRIYNLTGEIRDNGGAILCLVGPPNRTVEWRILAGHGTLTPFATFTDPYGRCSCRFDAVGLSEVVTVGAAFVI